ncbi:MAG: hypothetical protein ABI772_03315 [Bacteroidota bacterium]
MFNPFVPFTKQLLDAMLAKNKKYFVRQTCQRGMPLQDASVKGAFIFTHYDSEKEAIVHYDGLKKDTYRFLYDATIPEHLERLNIAGNNPEPYRIFAAVARPGWEEEAKKHLLEKVKYFTEHKLSWKPSRADGVNLKLYIQFGQLFAEIRLHNQKIKVNLEEIEKL